MYIGSTVQRLSSRMTVHRSQYPKRGNATIHLLCEADNKKKAHSYEHSYILMYQTFRRWNKTITGRPGDRKHTKECRAKMSEHSKGSQNNGAKLTEEDVHNIRSEYTGARGEQTMLARKYGVDPTNISLIVRHKIWTHI